MLRDGGERPCVASDISATRLVITGAKTGRPGDRVIAYIERLGRVEGTIERRVIGGFHLAIHAEPRKRARLAAKIDWLARRLIDGSADLRREERVEAWGRQTTLRASDGHEYPVSLIDLSIGGAAFYVEADLSVGEPVTLAGVPAIVARRFVGGLAVRFDHGKSRAIGVETAARTPRLFNLAEFVAEQQLLKF